MLLSSSKPPKILARAVNSETLFKNRCSFHLFFALGAGFSLYFFHLRKATGSIPLFTADLCLAWLGLFFPLWERIEHFGNPVFLSSFSTKLDSASPNVKSLETRPRLSSTPLKGWPELNSEIPGHRFGNGAIFLTHSAAFLLVRIELRIDPTVLNCAVNLSVWTLNDVGLNVRTLINPALGAGADRTFLSNRIESKSNFSRWRLNFPVTATTTASISWVYFPLPSHILASFLKFRSFHRFTHFYRHSNSGMCCVAIFGVSRVLLAIPFHFTGQHNCAKKNRNVRSSRSS